MPTTVHIPPTLLTRVDLAAKALGVSRNRLIVEALEARLSLRDRWSPSLLRLLREAGCSGGVQRAAGRLDAEILAGRRSRRRPPTL